MKDCLFCKSSKNLLIKKYKHWTVLLHPYQDYLGRCWIKSNRHTIDFLETGTEEKKELLEIMKKLKEALEDLFHPDLFNYASLGNTIRHLHVHFIPRYEGKRIFKGIQFIDERWGKIHKPYKGKTLKNETFNELKRQISQKLK